MDFFEAQDVARRHSVRLLVLFVLAVLGIIVTTYLLVAGLIVMSGHGPGSARSLADPGLLVLIGGATILIVTGGSLWKLNQLRGGGRVVAESLGGRLLVSAGADWKAQRLLNVVDEMAIASGVPAPAVYLLPEEHGINAFAAGHSPQDAVIAVTQGCLDRLTREQLQGVIGHEFSHVLNGDMALSLRLIGVLNGILLIGLLGHAVLRTLGSGRVSLGRQRGKGGGGLAVVFAIAVGLVVIGFVGLFFGNLIKAAVSRQRELLADGASVQFTRNPGGLAGALKAIGAVPGGSRLVAPNAGEASHMYFAQGLAAGLQAMFATHPPLADRIRRIEPSWDGTFPDLPDEVQPDDEALAAAPGGGAPLAGDETRVVALDGAAAGRRAVERAGRPTPAHVEHAAALIGDLPEPLRTAAREPWGARAVVFALLVHPDGAPREAQLRRLDALADAGVADFTRKLLPVAADLPHAARLPLVDLAIPALRALSPAQHDEFMAVLDDLFAADGALDLFEWSLSRVLRRHLASAQGLLDLRPASRQSLDDVGHEVAVLLSALARAGAQSASAEATESAAAAALGQAAASLSRPALALVPETECGTKALDAALDALVALHPLRKRELLAACAACIVADGEVRIEEVELLRAFADGLQCPLPPLLPAR